MMRDTRQKYERGTILFHLQANRGISAPMSFVQLQRGLRMLNLPLTAHDLRDLLEYLVAKGYVEVARMGDVFGLRLGGDDAPDHILTVRLTATGVDLLEGTTRDDGVATP
jgi:hypothetical protein